VKPEPWVEEALRAKGVWNDDGVSRKAHARRCSECGAVILMGLDADRIGGVARADLAPLTPVAEALAVSPALGERATYRLLWIADHYELNSRYAIEREGSPPDPGTVDVVAAHVCGVPVSTLRLTRPVSQRTRAAIDHDGPVPF